MASTIRPATPSMAAGSGAAAVRAARRQPDDAQYIKMPEASFSGICAQLRGGELSGPAAVEAFERIAEKMPNPMNGKDPGDAAQIDCPVLGEEVVALPGKSLEEDGTIYYEAGDSGRVSSSTYTSDGEPVFDITWYRTGLTSWLYVENWRDWVRHRAQKIGKGSEVVALPGKSLEEDGTIYFEAGDTGRVSSGIKISDGEPIINITWYRTGLTSWLYFENWMTRVRLVDRKSELIGPEALNTMEDAVKGKDVAAGKPMELISGQPKSAAMGLYHFMRVKDPYADDSVKKIEQEVKEFAATLKEYALLMNNLDRAPQDREEIERVYGTGHIEEAKEELGFFRKLLRLTDSAGPLAVASKVSEETVGNLQYILYEKTSEVYVEGPNAIRDKGRDSMSIDDFMADKNVEDAELTKAHVAALRFYTTPAFKYLNAPLRNQSLYYDKHKPHPMPITVAYISEGIKKLRAAYAIKVEAGRARPRLTLWRGLKNMFMPGDFTLNRKGGTELAPMSTTVDLAVAVKYACSGDSVLLKISLDNFMQYGAELKWLSAFPGEDEVLYPPLTYLQPSDREPQLIELSSGHKFTVYEVKPTIP